MRKLLILLPLLGFAAAAAAQETQLPENLQLAVNELADSRDSQFDISNYVRFHDTENAQWQSSILFRTNDVDFYELYKENFLGIYGYRNYDPVITNMPAPGPNLDYWNIDCNSPGNFMTVKE